MNEKKCKALRRAARDKAIGMPPRWLVGKKMGNQAICAVNSMESFRGIYRQLKREAEAS